MKNKFDICIIGGGAAGLSAALEAYDSKLSILIIEREKQFGGILNQCIHNGFGLHVFNEELTGPEYAYKLIEDVLKKEIDYLLDTTVLDIKKDENFIISASNIENGPMDIIAKSVILTTGCYERTRGHISIPGDRPKGIMTAGSAQRYLNIDGYLVGQNVFILGSGDIGLIMARRMTLEGANVLGVAELMPHSNGLTRNVVQCLHDFDIPLYLSHTVVDVKGKERLEEITIQQVDEKRNLIPKTEKVFKVDTLLLSVGLIPDVKLFDSLTVDVDPITKSAIVTQNLESSVSGLFICGNALHVHDLVDDVTIESKKAGKYAKDFVMNSHKQNRRIQFVQTDQFIQHIIPQQVDFNDIKQDMEFSFRTLKKFEKVVIEIYQSNQLIKSKKAAYVVPAEMQKIVVKASELHSNEPIEVRLKEVSSS